MTDLSGEHDHDFNLQSGVVGPENQMHIHGVTVRTIDGPVNFTTSEGTNHIHELQSFMTTLSGVHQHTVQIMDEQFVSLVPSDLIEEVMEASKSVKQFKNLNLRKSDDPMEVNYLMVKRINEPQFKEILRKGVERSIIKRMTKLSEGLRIESLIISRERFSDIGLATNFVLEQGLDIKSSQVLSDKGVFTFKIMARDSFEESTLQRIRITEGVEAIIGFLAEREPEQDMTIGEATDVRQSENLQSKEDDATIVESEKEIGMNKKKKDLKDKFKNVMSSYDLDEEEAEELDLEEDQSRFKCVYEILSKNDDKRLMVGPVLIPDNIDLQDDIINKEEIEKAAHGYMVKLAYRDDREFLLELGFKEVDKAGERGFQHTDFSRKMAVVETFIAPVDFELNGRTITKGTWVMTMKVFDDEVWAMVKTGKITGFSIGGRSKSRPAKVQE